MKKIIAVIFCLLLALGIVLGLPELFDNKTIEADFINEVSLVDQKVIEYLDDEVTYSKIYNKGRLIGVVSDYDYLLSLIKDKYNDYKDDFPDTELGLGEDTYVVNEKSNICFENVDDKIFAYLVDNSLLGIKTTAVEFSTDNGVYEIIYVKSSDDFYAAIDDFLLNFISEESLTKIRNNETISNPEDYGVVETGISILESITTKEAIVSPDNILVDKKEIYEFLCYGRNSDRQYYTTVEGDTLQGVGYYFGDMSPKQIVMLNPDVLASPDQVITPGMTLNVTYYTSPITVVVTKENLSQETTYPEAPLYIQDEELDAGISETLVEEETGLKNTLYEETWVNGVLEQGKLKSETVVKEPVQGVISIGTHYVNLIGTGNFQWPVDNPGITCLYMCRANHTGIDIVNEYETYCNIYAADSGVVSEVGYLSDMGYYIYVDHQNGFTTIYMHLNEQYVEVGQSVVRGQLIAQMGNTGRSYGVHLHFTIEYEGERMDPCEFLPCSIVS
ncbi:MAG: peptidoglycan DD-metalloendopeptidase family protein [Erysipelotrichaceae bacterium]|nr:peptidoglycan DD-metalloendopeptidase family protein [Erysipelotrichaceae bacterium]